MKQVFVALGSNMGASKKHLRTAVAALQLLSLSRSFKLSPWYLSAPLGGPANQPDYINAVSVFMTTVAPLELLGRLQEIEDQEARVRDVRWGPRTLDLDIIWFQGAVMDSAKLTLPHPRAHLRAFVLKPLCDLQASFTLQGKTPEQLLPSVSDQVLKRIEW